MALTADQELWTIALHVEKQHGDDGPRFIAERIGALAANGDDAGVDRWKAVAAKYDQLMASHAKPADLV